MTLSSKAPVPARATLPEIGVPVSDVGGRIARNVDAEPKVSVVIPLYNHAKYIEAAIGSVLAQTVRPAEIIVIDDGSTDGSAEVVHRLCKEHPEIIFWSWSNQGAHHTLNAGILRATGDFVAFLNSDDCFEPNRLATCLALVRSDASVDVVATGASFVDDQGKAVLNPWYDDALAFYRQEKDVAFALFRANFLVTTSNLFVRRSVFETVGTFAPLRYAHDLEFILRLILGKKHIYFLDQPLVTYRLHEKNTISENKAREDIERAAVFAFFLYRQWRSEAGQRPWRHSLERYVEVLGQQDILEIVEEFLVLLEDQPAQEGLAVAGALPTEFRGFLSRLGVDWAAHGSVEPLLARFAAAREVFLRRRNEAPEVERLKADIEWLNEQRRAWEKAAQAQEDQAKSLSQALQEARVGSAWLLEQRNAWEQQAQAREEQAKSLTEALQVARDGNAWLFEQRNAWEQTAQAREEHAKSLTEALEDLRVSNGWLLEQRNAWERAAQAQEGRAKSLTQTLEDMRIGNEWLESQRLAWQELASKRELSIGDLNSRLNQFKETISSLESQRAERDKNIAELMAERSRILNSLSWKMTKPLRYVRRKFATFHDDFVRKIDTRTYEHDVPISVVTVNGLEQRELGRQHRILLVLHEFSRTGAPRAILYLARALFVLHGVRPVVMATTDGPIREEFEHEGFPTKVEPLLFEPHTSSSDISELVSSFERVIVTPLSSFLFVRHFKGVAKHLTWWIHEEGKGFAYIADNFSSDLSSLFDVCDAVWLGSPLCFEPVSQYAATARSHLLLYGCDDISIPHRPHQSGRMVFTLVGSIEPRKGQDIFLEAIQRLDPDLRCKAVFRIVGSPYNDWSASFHEKVRAQAHIIPEVECIPNVPFQQLRELYAETDIVVSASRADPMPISITQGLMFSKVCLCSSAIGHAHLLEDRKNGLIFASESVEALSTNMAWLLENPVELTVLGAGGRAVYEQNFLMDGFIRNVEYLLQDNVSV